MAYTSLVGNLVVWGGHADSILPVQCSHKPKTG